MENLGRQIPPRASWSPPGPSQLQIAPKALGREEKGANEAHLQDLGASSAGGWKGRTSSLHLHPHPSTSSVLGSPCKPTMPPKAQGGTWSIPCLEEDGGCLAGSCHIPARARSRSSRLLASRQQSASTA